MEEEQVDVVNNLQVTGKKVTKEGNRPLFKGFLHDSVVGVAKGLGDKSPGFIPVEAFTVNKDSLKFGNSQCRVGIIKLDGNLLGEFSPRTAGLLKRRTMSERKQQPKSTAASSEAPYQSKSCHWGKERQKWSQPVADREQLVRKHLR